MKKKTIVFIVVGGILVLTFSLFVVLLVKSRREADPHNEDAVLAEAKAAEERDDPPAAVRAYERLKNLNQLNEDYANKYAHALIRMRAFDTLATYTNKHPMTVELTEDERKTEELIEKGRENARAANVHVFRYIRALDDLVAYTNAHPITVQRTEDKRRTEELKLVVRSEYSALLGSNAVAVAAFKDATNLNYYAATPLLIDLYASYGYNFRFDLALDAARPYLRRFPLQHPELVVRTAEWCALAKRTDLLAELRADLPKGAERFQIVFQYYCDALEAWDKGDMAALAKAMNAVGTDIRSPLARLLKLEAVASEDDADSVEKAYRDLRDVPPPYDFPYPLRGKLAVKRFIAAHFPSKEFPDRKYSIAALGRLADLLMEDGTKDVDITRVSLFAKIASNSLSEYELDKALKQFPDDKGIQMICEQHRRNVAKAAAAAAEAKAAEEAKIAAEAKKFKEREAAAEAKAAAAVKAAEAAKAAEKAKAAEVGKE